MKRIQRHLVILGGLVLLAGCAPRPGTFKPAPAPPAGDPVAAAAEQSIREYATGLARVAREKAARAETFKTNADLYDVIEKASGEVHTQAFAPLGAAADRAVPPDAPYDTAAVKRMLESEASGFEQAVSAKP